MTTLNQHQPPDAERGAQMLTPAKKAAFMMAIFEVTQEAERAMSMHAPMNSAHEAYAVILEELEEFWIEVMKKRELRTVDAMRTELKQIAAMAIRAIVDVVPVAEVQFDDIPF